VDEALHRLQVAPPDSFFSFYQKFEGVFCSPYTGIELADPAHKIILQSFPARSIPGSIPAPSRRCATSCPATQGARRTPLHPYGHKGHPVFKLGDGDTPGTPRYLWKNFELKEYWKWRATF